VLERQRLLERFKKAVSDEGIAIARVDSKTGRSVSTEVLHSDGEITNQEDFPGKNPIVIFQTRQVVSKMEAFVLRGAGILGIGVMGAGIAMAIKHKSVMEFGASVAIGGAAVLAEIGSENRRLAVRSLKAREAKVNEIPSIVIPPKS
jgi:hypothetical protein